MYISEKVDIYATNSRYKVIQTINGLNNLRLFQKSDMNMTMSDVPTNPGHGVSWIIYNIIWVL